MAQKRLANRGFIGNQADVWIRLCKADDLVILHFVHLQVLELQLGTDMDHLCAQSVLIKHLGIFQHRLDFADPGFQLALLTLCLVVLTIFRQVAKRKRHLDLFRHFLTPDGF